jgi:hypothetical protein
MNATLWDIFYLQSKFSSHPGASTMLEDFAIKGIQKGFSATEIIAGLGEYYRQCDEVGKANYERAKLILAKEG